MTDFWRTQRLARITSPTAASPLVLVDGPDGGFAHHPTRLILGDIAAERLAAVLVPPEFTDITDLFPWFPELGLRMLRIETGEDAPTKADELEAALVPLLLPGDDADRSFVEVDHVLFGVPKYHGNPGDAPAPAGPWSDVTTPSITEVGDPTVAVLDTGIAEEAPAGVRFATSEDEDDRDALLPAGAGLRPLAAQAGHGTFIVGLVERMAGGDVRIDPGRVLDPDGVGYDSTVSKELFELAQAVDPVQVVNLSLGGYTRRDTMPPALGAALKTLPSTTVVVAAAGNGDQDLPPSDRKHWPAAHPDVVGVGSLHEDGGRYERSWFSNFGSWVDVWTLGEGLLSTFVFGDFETEPGVLVHFDGWATWSGTSFAAPLITAEIARRRDGRSGMDTWASMSAELRPVADILVAPEEGVGGLAFDPRTDGIEIDPRRP